MGTLIIAEKDKAAKAIAEAFGTVKSITKQNTSRVYHVPSRDIYVLPLRGHILEYRTTPAFKNWTKPVPRDIITDFQSIKKFPIKNIYHYINALKEYSKICDHCVIGTDADIEGVNIGLSDALPFVKKVNTSITLSQIWLSSLQKNEIIKKFSQRISPKWSWADTGDARAIIDAIIGFSGTREITNTLKPLLRKLDTNFVSIGRVQTSLLYLIYLRDQAIKKFVSERYWTLEVILSNKSNMFKAFHDLNPFKMEQEIKVKNIFQDIKNEKFAKIVSKINNIIVRKPPIPLDTSQALILLTKNLGINANMALRTMEALYLNKIISYPRTDSNVYKDDFDHIQYIKKFASHTKFGRYTLDVIGEKRFNPTRGRKDAGDHPPITPLESLEQTSSKFENELQKKVYDLLARHYLALFGKDARESKTVLKLLIKIEPFTAQTTALINEGYLEIVPFLKKRHGIELDIQGDEIPIKNVSLNDKETQPQPLYTDVSLLKLMERYRLGTKSTRPKIIEILVKRTLIQRNRRQYSISNIGRFLIDQLKIVWLPFLKPKFTRSVELLLEDIKLQKKRKDEVIDTVRNIFLALFDRFLAKRNKLLKKMTEFQSLTTTHTQLKTKKARLTASKCFKCNNYQMELVTTHQRKRFLACTDRNCKTYLSVPKRGRIQILKSFCSKCGFDIFKIHLKKNGRIISYYMCPKCWNEGLNDKQGKGFCSKCIEFSILKDKCMKK
jgi:DNA topoisomerase IA